MRRILAVPLLALLALPASASAHHLTSGTATCTGVLANYASFSEANKPISFQVYVDTVLKVSGSGTFPGSSGQITVTFDQPLPAGDHVVNWTSSWPGQGSENGSFTQTVHGCAGPPTPPTQPTPPVSPPTAPPAPPVPPAVAPPTAPPSSTTATTPGVKTPETGGTSQRRFGRKGHPTKKCERGRHRKQFRDSKGRRFTMCVRNRPPIVRTPKFTG